MNKIISLSKVFLKSSFKMNYNRENSNKKLLFMLFSGILVIYIATVFGYLSYSIIKPLKEVNQEGTFIALLVLAASISLMVFSIMSAINIFYFSKDNVYLLPLPIEPYKIITAKFISILTTEYITLSIFGIVPIIVYGVMTKFTLLFIIKSLIVFIIIPIFPVAIACIIITLLMSLGKNFRNKDLFQIIITVIGIGAIVLIQMYVNTNIKIDNENVVEFITKANGLVDLLAKYLITIKPSVDFISKGDLATVSIAFIKLIGITSITYLIYLFIATKLYLKGLIGNSFSASNSKTKTISFKNNSVGKSYILKELRLLYRNPIYFIQCVLPSFLLPIILTYSLLISSKGELFKLISDSSVNIGDKLMLLIIGNILFMTFNFISLTSISREGENAVFSKYIPISFYKQILYKSTLGIIFNLIPIIYTFVVFIIFVSKTYILYCLITLLIVLIINILYNLLMTVVDLKRPKLLWDSEYAVVKQNMNMLFEFGLLIALSITFFIIFYFSQKLNINMYLLLTLILCLSLIFTYIINRYIHKNQKILFDKIN